MLLLVAVGAGGWQLVQWRNQPPVVNFVKVEKEDEPRRSDGPSSDGASTLTVRFALSHTFFGHVLSKFRLCRGKISVELQPDSAAGAAGLAAARAELWAVLRETMAEIETVTVRRVAEAAY